ncbi:MAG TPA: membrane protein insertase YidC [Treponemataceae bacterium]|nr:membrane protein insertase YidC [Treponemataceae bacterium]
MEKNTIIAILLSTLVVVATLFVQAKFFPPTQAVTKTETQQPVIADAGESQGIAASSALVDSGDSAIAGVVTTIEGKAPAAEERVVIETDLVKVEFTNKGGDIVSYKLKKHLDKDGEVEMADAVTAGNRAFSIILGDANGPVIDQLFNVKRISDTEIGFFKAITVRGTDGKEQTFTLAKQYSFKPDDYVFELKVIIDGDSAMTGLQFGNAGYTIRTSPQIGPRYEAKKDKYEFRRFFHLVNGKKKNTTVNAGQTKLVTDKWSWAGVGGKYFIIAALPEAPVQSATYSTLSEPGAAPNAQLFVTRTPVAGNRQTDVWRFYVGPRTEKDLVRYNLMANNPYGLNDTQLDKALESSGILAPLERLLKWIMELFYKVVKNWGVSIILLTVLTRLLFFPLTRKSSEASVKMQEVQPRIQEIQEKYRGNPQKLNEEMAKLYQATGYNPVSGCLPLLIQFPLIFAMYNLFNNYFEFRGAMFIPGWIPDLSRGDSVLSFGYTLPLNISELRLLPIIYVISQLVYGKVTQTPGTTQQNSTMKFMMYGMPLIFFFIFYNAPSGLLIYWTFSNVLTMGQQVIINRMMHRKKAASAAPAK